MRLLLKALPVVMAAGTLWGQGVVQNTAQSSATNGSAAASSTAAADPITQLSPGAAFEQAMRPVDITRRSTDNWSDVEKQALGVAVTQAQLACAAHNPGDYKGEDQLAYARLCALAQRWDMTRDAATLYITAQDQTFMVVRALRPGTQMLRNGADGSSQELTSTTAVAAPTEAAVRGLTMAFMYQVEASIHLEDASGALGSAREMMQEVPYSDLTSEAVGLTVIYLELVRWPEAVALQSQRQGMIRELLRKMSAASDAVSSAATATTAPTTPTSLAAPVVPETPAAVGLSVHALYADGMMLPTLLQMQGETARADAALRELEAVLPKSPSADDAVLMAETRRQYELLGKRLPEFASFANMRRPGAIAAQAQPVKLEGYGSAMVLLLFPDWCAQCVRAGIMFSAAEAAIGKKGARFAALLAQDGAPPPPPAAPVMENTLKASTAARAKAVHETPKQQIAIDATAPKTPDDALRGTSTYVVPNGTLRDFAATDFPLLVVTDHDGVVRFVQTAPDDALKAGGMVEKVVENVLARWPVKGSE